MHNYGGGIISLSNCLNLLCFIKKMLGHRSDIRVPEDCMCCSEIVNGRKTGGVTFFLVFRGKDGAHGN